MSINRVETPALAPGCWDVDVENSTAEFTVRNFGRAVSGAVPIRRGRVEIGVDGEPCAATASLDLSEIRTGNARRDSDLRKPGLLDLDNHPLMTFTADRFDGWRIEGTLEARGTSARVAGTVEQISGRDEGAVTLHAVAVLDRRELRLRAPRFLIGHVIGIDVRAHVRLDPQGA